MIDELQKVREFHELANHPVDLRLPANGVDEKLMTIAGCLLHYANELRNNSRHLEDLRAGLTIEETAEQLIAMAIGDEEGYADALADSLYVLLGNAITYQTPLYHCFTEVHRSNMTKSYDENGNLLPNKGPNYQRPNLGRILHAAFPGEELYSQPKENNKGPKNA